MRSRSGSSQGSSTPRPGNSHEHYRSCPYLPPHGWRGAKSLHCDLPKALRRDLTLIGGLQDLGSDMGPNAGFAARQVVANLLKNSTQKRSGRCVQHLATPQGAKNGSRESTVNPSKRLLADSKVEYELHHNHGLEAGQLCWSGSATPALEDPPP